MRIGKTSCVFRTADQAVAADQEQLGSIDVGSHLAAYFCGRVGFGQHCCWPLNADPLDSNGRERVNMVCRRPKLSDARGIAESHVLAWQRAYAGIMPGSFLNSLAVVKSEAQWREILRSGDAEVLVIERAGAVRGFSRYGASRDDDATSETAEIYAINIHPDHWRESLGSSLLAASLVELGATGYGRATLWVLEANRGACDFYEAHGWGCDGTQKLDGPPGCPELPHLRYEVEVAV